MAGGMLDKALRDLVEAEVDAQAAARISPTPAPPDAELSELFQSFAARMPRAAALPFVVYDRVVVQDPKRAKQYKKKPWLGNGESVRYDAIERGRGWFMGPPAKGVCRSVGEGWFGLAIAVDATPWFVLRYPRNAPDLIIGGEPNISREHKPYLDRVGPPTGASLRKAILTECDLRFQDPSGELEVSTGPFHYTTRPKLDPNPLERLVPHLVEVLAENLFAADVKPS